jgi:hypothetical protein
VTDLTTGEKQSNGAVARGETLTITPNPTRASRMEAQLVFDEGVLVDPVARLSGQSEKSRVNSISLGAVTLSVCASVAVRGCHLCALKVLLLRSETGGLHGRCRRRFFKHVDASQRRCDCVFGGLEEVEKVGSHR